MATFMAPSTVTINLILSMLFLFLFLYFLWQRFYMTVSAVHCNLRCLRLIFFWNIEVEVQGHELSLLNK